MWWGYVAWQLGYSVADSRDLNIRPKAQLRYFWDAGGPRGSEDQSSAAGLGGPELPASLNHYVQDPKDLDPGPPPTFVVVIVTPTSDQRGGQAGVHSCTSLTPADPAENPLAPGSCKPVPH